MFDFDILDNTVTAYNKLVSRIANLSDDGEVDMAVAQEYIAKFKENMDNDLNTSLGLTSLYDVLKSKTNDKTKLYLIADFDKVLSLNLIEEANKIKAENDSKTADVDVEKIEELIKRRTQARAEKDWATADKIRDELASMHVIVKDSKDGITWEIQVP